MRWRDWGLMQEAMGGRVGVGGWKGSGIEGGLGFCGL